MMYKYAEIQHGAIVAIYEDERDFTTWKNIFDPDTFWVDVTNQDVEVGYGYKWANGELTFFAPEQKIIAPDLDDKGVLDTMQDKIDNLESENAIFNDLLLTILGGDEVAESN